MGVVDEKGLCGCDVMIHLAGENIGNGRWTPEKRARIVASREDGTALLARTISKMKEGPRHFLSASAVGFYGNQGARAVTEKEPRGDAFISEVCDRWEGAARKNWSKKRGRLVCLRIGVVLTPAGGALARLLPFFKAGVGGVIGSGHQHMSWISMEDVLGSFLHIIDSDKLEGPVNLTAPSPVTSRLFSRTLAGVLNRFSAVPLPSFLVQGIFGEMGKEVLLDGVNARPEVLEKSGYSFVHSSLEAALSEVVL